MAQTTEGYGPEYRQGFRDALSAVLRGVLLVDADQVDVGEVIASLSRYEEQVKTWAASDEPAAPPAWHPTARELGGEEA